MPERAAAHGGPPELVPDRAQAATSHRRGHGQGRLGAGRPDPVGQRRTSAAPERCTSPAARGVPALGQAVPRRALRPPVPAARPAERRRPDARPGGQAHGLGLHARPAAGRRLGPRRRRSSPSAWRRRSSASPPASATASSPATSSSPADLEARNPNLIGGDVGGGSYRLRQVVFRPLPKLSPYSTPLKGLFIGSAATFPGRRRPRRPRGRRRPRRAQEVSHAAAGDLLRSLAAAEQHLAGAGEQRRP